MKQHILLLFVLILLAVFPSCALQGTNVPDTPPQSDIAEQPQTPQPAPSEPVLPTEPSLPTQPSVSVDPPLPEPVFSAVDNTVVDQLAGNTVTITTPTVELPSAEAAENINQYFQLLAGKVRDYAEGDLSIQPGITSTVHAGYTLTRVSDTVLSFLWTVETTTTSPELPGNTAVSAVSFDPGTGRILTFRDIFGERAADVKALFLTEAKTIIAQREEHHYYYDGWDSLAAETMDESCFYLTDEGVCLFYPREALGTHTDVLLTWDTLAGYLAITP